MRRLDEATVSALMRVAAQDNGKLVLDVEVDEFAPYLDLYTEKLLCSTRRKNGDLEVRLSKRGRRMAFAILMVANV